MKIQFRPTLKDCFNIHDVRSNFLGHIHGPRCDVNQSDAWEVTAVGEPECLASCNTLAEAKAAAIAYWF